MSIETIEPVEEVPSILKKRTRKSVIKPSVEVVSFEEKPVKVVKKEVVKIVKEKKERTEAEIQAAKDKMAQVRAARKPKVPKESKE